MKRYLFEDGQEVKHIRDGKLKVKCREYKYMYKSYMYLLSNGLWYLESDLDYI
jgi:Tfp pilus assembly protein PilZ